MIFYSIGKIVTTHGIKGEVKVLPDTDFDRFKVGATVYADQKPLVIKSVRRQNAYFLVSFEGLPTLTSVEPLRKLEIFTKEEPDDLGEDEFHLPKLVGLDVWTGNNFHVGIVESVVEVPQGHLLRIKTNDNKSVLVPFVKAFIKSVSTDGIFIDVIEGLL